MSYGYIRRDGRIGQIFETFPEEGLYHENYRQRIVPVPDGAAPGWRQADGGWLPPEPPVFPADRRREVTE